MLFEFKKKRKYFNTDNSFLKKKNFNNSVIHIFIKSYSCLKCTLNCKKKIKDDLVSHNLLPCDRLALIVLQPQGLFATMLRLGVLLPLSLRAC